jgi:uncharacterized protein YkwD
MGVAIRCLVLACLTGWTDEKPAEKFQLTPEEQTLLELTNKERAKKKLPPVSVSPLLTRVARAHSANMARQEKMEHVLDGKTAGQRAEKAGYRLGRVGENIAAGEEWTAAGLIEDWMNSKRHRDNILSPGFTEVGFGLAKTGKGEVYYTQLFGRPAQK